MTMPGRQLTDCLKDAPFRLFRAAFAGLGQLLLAADRIRREQQARNGPRPPGRPARPAAGPPVTGPAAPAEPLPGYDSWSLPSLRARLRTLSAAQLRALAEYERATSARPDVLTMFERRLAKLGGGS